MAKMKDVMFPVRILLKEPVTVSEVKSFVVESLAGADGGLHPDDPMFGNVLLVKIPPMSRNRPSMYAENTSKRVASIAARGMNDPKSLSLKDIASVCASCVTQREPHAKKKPAMRSRANVRGVTRKG